MQSKITYRQQYTRCGKQRCRKCREGEGHGPYWYAYWSEKGRTVSKYMGVRLPPEVEAARHASGETLESAASIESVPGQPGPVLRVYLLGQFRVERKSKNEWKVVDNRIWQRRRARALLGCLLSSSGRRLGREQVMEQLWPDLDIDVAANRLNGAVHELRQILEPDLARPAASRMLRLERDILELADSTQLWVDVEAFENLLKEANALISSQSEQAERLLEEAASLYGGSYLLEELYSEWAAHRRDALQRRWVGLLLDLANLRTQRGAFVSAIEALDRLRIAEPSNETALQRLMVLLTQLDRRGEALQVYRQHEATMQREYESEPLPETQALYEALCKGQLPASYIVKPQVHQAKAKEEASLPQPSGAPQELPFVRPAFQSGRHNQSPLVGRGRELDTMRKVMLSIEALGAQSSQEKAMKKDAQSGQGTSSVSPSSAGPRRPHFLLLTGEPGLGKTRLAEELSSEANTRGWAVVWSRAYEQEGNIPYRSWIEVLRTLLQSISTITATLDTSNPSNAASPLHPSPALISLNFQLERLGALLPELPASTASVSKRSTLPYEQERLHLWEATLGLLSALSKTHPLLLVLDDLHWTDDSSIELLAYLTHHLREQRILLIGTCRDGELTSTHKLRTLIADLRREQAIVTLTVQPLTKSQIAALVAHLPQALVKSIQTQAAGNPFFAEELARYVVSTSQHEGMLSSLASKEEEHAPSRIHTSGFPSLNAQAKVGQDLFPRHSLPEAVAGLLERRLSRLSSECQTLLGKAAVLGGSFELGQLLPMASEHFEDSILDLLEEALQEGLLTEAGTGAHITYSFWHPLIVSHLYERLSAARRAQLHRRAADAIKTASASLPSEKVASTIVHHLSRGGGNVAQIAYYAELAGNQAFSLAAYSEAEDYYLQAISAIVGITTSEEATSHTSIERITTYLLAQPPLFSQNLVRLCRLMEFAAQCSAVQGNFEDARHLYESILAVRTSDAFQQQTASAEVANGTPWQQEAQIQAILWREIGNTWIATGEYDRAYKCTERGKEVMHQAGVTTGAAWAYLHLQYGAILRYEGNYSEARRYSQEALEVLEQVVYQPQFEYTSSELSHAGLNSTFLPSSSADASAGQFPRELQRLQTHTERALLGDPLYLGRAYEHLGIIAASLGQVSDALTHLHAALTLYEQQGAVTELVRICGNLGAVYIMKGDHGSARTFLQRSLDLAERIGNLSDVAFIEGNLGDVAHRSGNLLEAEEWFNRSLAIAESIHDREHISWCNVMLANVQQDLGHLREASASLSRAISVGRAIKSSRCVRFALVSLGDLRILEAIIACKLQPMEEEHCPEQSITCQRLLMRAKSTLQRAISQLEVEVESVIDCKLLLATVYFLLDDLATAQHMALQTMQEAQEQETIRVIGRAQRLLGRILAAQGQYEEADAYFEQALETFRKQELRLDYARTLHSYGITLIQRSLPDAMTQAFHEEEQKQQTYFRGIDYLQEARDIFAASQAAIDLTWVEGILSSYELFNAGKR